MRFLFLFFTIFFYFYSYVYAEQMGWSGFKGDYLSQILEKIWQRPSVEVLQRATPTQPNVINGALTNNPKPQTFGRLQQLLSNVGFGGNSGGASRDSSGLLQIPSNTSGVLQPVVGGPGVLGGQANIPPYVPPAGNMAPVTGNCISYGDSIAVGFSGVTKHLCPERAEVSASCENKPEWKSELVKKINSGEVGLVVWELGTNPSGSYNSAAKCYQELAKLTTEKNIVLLLPLYNSNPGNNTQGISDRTAIELNKRYPDKVGLIDYRGACEGKRDQIGHYVQSCIQALSKKRAGTINTLLEKRNTKSGADV